jgi:hypothetical protein
MPHGHFDVRISGVDDRQLRRWQQQAAAPYSPALVLKVICVAGVFWLAPTLASVPMIDLGGLEVGGRQVLLIQDGSGSMNAYQAVVDRRVAALRAAGAYTDLACPRLSNTEFQDFVACVTARAPSEGLDGLYVFADFEWDFTAEGLSAVRRALERTNVRLYLDTIGAAPPADLRRLVETSGGAVIRTPKLVS